jgi:hypothetical protein
MAMFADVMAEHVAHTLIAQCCWDTTVTKASGTTQAWCSSERLTGISA